MTQTKQVSLVIFTCEGREHLLQKSYDSFMAACNYPFAQVILAIDGAIDADMIAYIKPDLVVYNYKRKGYVNSIKNALANINTGYFFWLEDDWKFHEKVDIEALTSLLEQNPDWAEIIFSQFGPLKPELKVNPLGNNFYQTPFGFSANPGLCASRHIIPTFKLLTESPKGGTPGVDGFENFLSRTFEKQQVKCVIIDPVDHVSISHEGYLESTPRNWHMTNSLETKTKEHLLTMPAPSFLRRALMLLKLCGAFFRLAVNQLFNNKVYELCFRIIASAKTVEKE